MSHIAVNLASTALSQRLTSSIQRAKQEEMPRSRSVDSVNERCRGKELRHAWGLEHISPLVYYQDRIWEARKLSNKSRRPRFDLGSVQRFSAKPAETCRKHPDKSGQIYFEIDCDLPWQLLPHVGRRLGCHLFRCYLSPFNLVLPQFLFSGPVMSRHLSIPKKSFRLCKSSIMPHAEPSIDGCNS